MSGVTRIGAPYPTGSDGPALHTQVLALAEHYDLRSVPYFADATVRNSTMGTPTTPQLCITAGVPQVYVVGSGWRDVATNLDWSTSNLVIRQFASNGARDTAIPSPVAGQKVNVAGQIQTRVGSNWEIDVIQKVGGLRATSTDANGEIYISHGLGVTPRFVTVATATTGNATIDNLAVVKITGIDATFIGVRVYRMNAAGILASSPVQFYWTAER